MSSEEQDIADLLDATEKLLESIVRADWETYAALCDPTLTAFEPETRGHLAEGMEFHRFYFDLGGAQGPVNTTVVSPHVRLLGDVGVVSYIRLVQRLDPSGSPIVTQAQETRVWQRQDGRWRHVHFHRSV